MVADIDRPDADAGGDTSDVEAPSGWDYDPPETNDRGGDDTIPTDNLPAPTNFGTPENAIPGALNEMKSVPQGRVEDAKTAEAREAFVKDATSPGYLEGVFDKVFGTGDIATSVKDRVIGSQKEQERIANDLFDRALEEANGDADLARQLIENGTISNEAKTQVIENAKSPAPDITVNDRGSSESGSNEPAPTYSSTKSIFEAANEEEKARIAALVKANNPYANMQQYQPIDISNATSPLQAESIRKYNELLASGAKSEALSADAIRGVIGATKLTDENRDAWKQYYNPADYKAQATQATAAQSTYTPVSPASLISGNYQGDLSRLAEYDSTIAQSTERAAALEAMDMARQRALGVAPSIAENSYLQNLDKLIKSQAAAAASVRGPGSALAQEAAARGAAALGQQAVRETAALRMQEQQAAEQLYASQANAIMIEDQKLNAQAKTNELSQLVNITQANLDNAKARLESDKFNANAINEVNRLDAQLRAQTANLNAQLQNNVNLQNASEANRVSMANAAQMLEASKYAGTSAQSALQAQIGLERADIASMYGYGSDAANILSQNLAKAAGATGAMASSNEAANLAQAQFLDAQKRYQEGKISQEEYNREAERYRQKMTAIYAGYTFAGAPGAVGAAVIPEEWYPWNWFK